MSKTRRLTGAIAPVSLTSLEELTLINKLKNLPQVRRLSFVRENLFVINTEYLLEQARSQLTTEQQFELDQLLKENLEKKENDEKRAEEIHAFLDYCQLNSPVNFSRTANLFRIASNNAVTENDSDNEIAPANTPR